MVNYGQKYMFGKWLIMEKCKCRANGDVGKTRIMDKVNVGQMVIMDKWKCRANGNYGQL